MSLLAGCQHTNNQAAPNPAPVAVSGDPLLGPPQVKPTSQVATGPAPSSNPLPTLPAPGSNTSTAALAGGNTQPPLDPSHDLRIASATGSGDAWHGQSPVQPAVLQQPQSTGPAAAPIPPPGGGSAALPVPMPSPPPIQPMPAPVQPAPANTAYAGPIINFEQAQAVLRNQGVTWQMLQTWGDKGEWKFSCSIPNAQNPNIRRTYEARAQTPLAAVQATIDQISQGN